MPQFTGKRVSGLYYTGATFASRAGFEAGCYFDKGKWTLFPMVNRHKANSFLEIKKADSDVFRQMLQNALSHP